MRLVCRDLLFDDAAALRLVEAAGPHGVYVRNALAAGEGDGFLAAVDGVARALVWVGPRGNLVVVADDEPPPVLAERLCDELGRRRSAWRIAMGPAAVVERLRERLPMRPLTCRDQVYYVGDARRAAVECLRSDVRPAERADRDLLMQATLQLNASDLNVDPARVDRRWLRDTIDERIANGSTRVVGDPGAVRCKLDYGSEGPGGRMLEGVFTFPEHRGQGLAAGLVATCLREDEQPACLHVGKHNRPARAAYERAGMLEQGCCRLLLLP